jgi:DnaJ family protein C protein 13
MLLVTIQRETANEGLFSATNGAALLASACELAFFTVKCSVLNAEELRREGGLDQLATSLLRFVMAFFFCFLF